MILAGLALAQEPTGVFGGAAVHGAEDFRLRYWHFAPEDQLEGFEDRYVLDYVEAVQRIDLTASSRGWQAAARVDGVGLFMNRYVLDGELHHEHDLVGPGLASPFPDAFVALEKGSLERRGRAGALLAGDAYTSFGRGLALNLVKNTEIDVDTSLRGVRGQLLLGDWEVTATSGVTNPQQVALENPNVALLADQRHAITAVRVDRWGLGPVNVGVHGVLAQFARSEEAGFFTAYGQAVDAAVGGATIEALGVAGLDLFAEADVFRYTAPEIAAKTGWAAYGSVAAYPGPVTVLAEVRANRDTEHLNTFATGWELASGPTLEYERVVTEDSSAAVNSNDIAGARVRADVRVGPAGGETTLLPYASFAAFRDGDTGALHFNDTPETIVHPIAGVQWLHGEVHVLLNGGYRADLRDPGEDGTDYGADESLHADAAIAFPIAGPVSVELAPAVLVYRWGDNAQQQADYTDVSNTLAVKVGSPWAILLYTDSSDNPLLASTGNLGGLGLPDTLYGALEVQWKPTSATTLKAFYGAYRAGIRCAGGQCRSLPGFDGGKVALTTTF
ncbi:MAG: hypothetical protein ACOZNI_35535 [Myxococcota bacterium]